MRLAQLRAYRFRNLEEVKIAFDGRVTVLYGNNAQGKTNLIEAIYLLSNLQSFRTRRADDLISSGDREAAVRGIVESTNGAVQLDLQLSRTGRVAKCDGKIPRSTALYLSEFHTVLFSPQDLALASGNQEARRRLLDRAAFLEDPHHLAALRRYHRVLRQRNACLKENGAGLAVWDEELLRTGLPIHRARRQALGNLEPWVEQLHAQISGGDGQLRLQWAAPYEGAEDVAAAFRAELERRAEHDRRQGFTTVGPHRDRLVVALADRRIEEHGSQGQLRTLALTLKLALLCRGKSVLGAEPVFLLDDPGSELDRDRLQFLGNFLSAWKGQVIVAGTERGCIPGLDAQGIHVTAGTVCRDGP